MRKPSIEMSGTPIVSGPSGASSDDGGFDGEGAGGRRDWSVGRDRSVGSRRSVLGLRRLGVRIGVPV